ncbi:hypothetical protein, partial [Longimicrobium sp.]|uniref:hypothetical protein n=1 Tax=Longimicrobium sp. TaxID=2029185 RepID=UPI002E2F5E94
MKVLFLLSPMFREWPRAMAREIHALEPGSSFPALVVGSRRIVARVQAWSDPGFSPLYDVDELERQWLATPSDPARLRELERRLVPGALNRILVSDRTVGAGFVSGARLASSGLLRGARSSPVEVPRRYVQGLVDFTWRTLEEHRPDVVFCYTVAGAHAMALAEVCAAMDIP